ncbi:MAG: hypothetical protein MJZ73_08145 [Bacteroidaceae bacterium]|nr:hypothetical protein [Bacteroidaceae bacterium]
MFVPKPIFKMLQNRSQLSLDQISHCDSLAADVERVTGKHIGTNTVKRLLGFYEEGISPRVSTLNIIANYLGGSDWDTLVQSIGTQASRFKFLQGELVTADLKSGCLLELTYLPDRKLLLEYVGDSRFRVVLALNSKLQEDDLVQIYYIIPSFPLIVSDVVRQGCSLGRYSAAMQFGVKTVKQLF